MRRNTCTYVAEIFPHRLRSQGVALGLSFFYLASKVTPVAAPVALQSIGWRFCVLGAHHSVGCLHRPPPPTIVLLFPETKGRTLEEIGASFGDEYVASHWYMALVNRRRNV